MSFLTLKTPVNQLKKAVISFWFRVPSGSAAGARAIAVDDPLSRVLHGVIPFITWGAQPIAHNKTLVSVYQGAVEVGGSPITTQAIGPGPDAPMSPSYLGLYVGTELNPQDPPNLDVRIQTQDFATGSNVTFLVTSWTGTNTGLTYTDPTNPNNPYNGAPIYADVVYQTTDVTNEYLGRAPDFFGSRAPGNVTFNQWHHLLISWDLDGRKMWCALDDGNLTGTNLPGNNDPGAGMGPNDQKSSNEFSADPALGESISLVVTTLPTNPVNVPGPGEVNYLTPEASPASKQPVQHCELAELQIFTGVTLNTGNETSRRAFIDKGGKPVPPNQKRATDADGNKIRDSGSIELLGKKPDVLLHGSSNWIKGVNTGTIGVDSSGKKIPSGQFTPTGKSPPAIKRYHPDPSLHGPQADGQTK